MKSLLATLILASVSLSFAQDNVPDRAALGRQMDAMTAKDWRPGVAFGDKLAALPSPIGYEILREHWTKGASVDARKQMFKGFVFSNHPDTLRVLHLGATDAQMELQNWSFTYLKDIAFKDFATDFASYKAWYAKYNAMPLKQVVLENATRLVAEARQAPPEARGGILKVLSTANLKFKDLSVPGALELATDILGSDSAGQDEARAAQLLVQMTTPKEAFYRHTVVPAARSKSPAVVSSALVLLSEAPGKWVTDELLTLLKETAAKPGGIERVGFNLGSALGDRKDPRAIPTVIGVIDAHNDYESVYGLGYFALYPLTGVSYDPSHNGAWWRKWWNDNRERLPAEIRDAEIPTIKIAVKPDPNKEVPDEEDVADIPGTEVLADGSRDMRALLAGPRGEAPKDGYQLLIVLPGGDGSAEFFPFLKRVAKHSLPKDMLLLQLVAKKWSDSEDRVVWPQTRMNPQKATFLTEEFVQKAIDAVAKKHKLNREHVYACGWSSGGPGVWATLLKEGSPLKGAFVAMSVYVPQVLPPAVNAKGKRVYILHSKEDFIPIKMAEQARDALKSAGATVEYATYEGGHGWHGDVFGYFRNAVEFLTKR
jgi:predicted esterase